MHPSETNSRTKARLKFSNMRPIFHSTTLAAGAPHIRAFCKCVGVCAIRGVLTLAVLCTLLLISARTAQAQTETVLYNFIGYPYDGGYPNASLTPDGKGNFYGTTPNGGLYGYGTVFELSPNGHGGWNESVLYSFPYGADGGFPWFSGVILDSAGNLYGTSYDGGSNGCEIGCGDVFELSPMGGGGWTETVLYTFPGGAGGQLPLNSLIMDSAGNLYGTAYTGGIGAGGIVFELSPSGGGWTEKTIYETSISGGLTMDPAGNIFGVTSVMGAVFELSPDGKGGWNSTVIYATSKSPKSNYLMSTPVLDAAGNIYGTSGYSGVKKYGTVYKLSRGRTGKWTGKVLHAFAGSPADGSNPYGGVVLDAAGHIYGTTAYGGSSGDGVVFELVGKGNYTEKVLWNFTGANGNRPEASLTLDAKGNLYGTTLDGGSGSAGVIFEVTP